MKRIGVFLQANVLVSSGMEQSKTKDSSSVNTVVITVSVQLLTDSVTLAISPAISE